MVISNEVESLALDAKVLQTLPAPYGLTYHEMAPISMHLHDRKWWEQRRLNPFLGFFRPLLYHISYIPVNGRFDGTRTHTLLLLRPSF